MPRTPERLPESTKKKPTSAPAKRPQKKSSNLLKMAAVGGVAGGALYAKDKWDKMGGMKTAKKTVAEKSKSIGGGINDALSFLGKKLGVTKKKPERK